MEYFRTFSGVYIAKHKVTKVQGSEKKQIKKQDKTQKGRKLKSHIK